MSTVTVDRHVLASNASSINLAWRSFGWTPAIAGPRATRLEEEVPWGTLADRSAHPGWLAGKASAIVQPENLDRLQWSFLPLDGRLGLSVWGATGSRNAAPGDRRVLTHTLLFDEEAFRHLAGYPFGLLGTPANPAGWLRPFERGNAFSEPTALEAIRLTVGPALTRAFETARIAEVRRLRTVLLAHAGGDAYALAYRVARVYEGLASIGDAGPIRYADRVAIRDDVEGAALLTRLVWLSLPLVDRSRIWFSTEQSRTERPRVHLMVLPTVEWGRSFPPATEVLDPSDPGQPGAPSPGRARWAAVVAGPEVGRVPVAVLRRADVRGWSLLGEDAAGASAAVEVARLLETWRSEGPAPSVAEALAQTEAGRDRPRRRAVGAYLARGAMARPQSPQSMAEYLVETCRAVDLPDPDVLRGAVRALVRSGPDGALVGGFVRCFSCLGPTDPVVLADLTRLGGPEGSALSALWEDPEGLPAVVLAAAAAERSGVTLGQHAGGRRVLEALGHPRHVADVLAAGSRIPAGPFLAVAGVEISVLAAGIDRVGPLGLDPEALGAVIETIASGEALGDLVRIWRRTEGAGPSRLQLLANPAWRGRPEIEGVAYDAARDMLTGSSVGALGGPDLSSERAVVLLTAWHTVEVSGGRLGAAESLLVAELLGLLADRGAKIAVLGEAVEVGQRTGGVVLGSPAVSPFGGHSRLIRALSRSGLEVLLERVAVGPPSRLPSPPNLLAAVLSNPEVVQIESGAALGHLLRLFWSEWTPEKGLPSLRRAVVEHGAAIQPLLDRLHDAPAPIPLGSVLRALRASASQSAPVGEGEPHPDRTLFLRSGGAP